MYTRKYLLDLFKIRNTCFAQYGYSGAFAVYEIMNKLNIPLEQHKNYIDTLLDLGEIELLKSSLNKKLYKIVDKD